MKRLFSLLFVISACIGQGEAWSIAYYSSNDLALADVQWNGLTHIAHTTAIVNADGTLDLTTEGISANAAALIAAAHARGVKVLLTLVQYFAGAPNTNFHDAISGHQADLVTNIMSAVNTYGYDGVDIDWEPFTPTGDEGTDMTNFASALRTALGDSKVLIAAASVFHYDFWNTVQSSFDRICVMTYDMGGTWQAATWHNSAVYDADASLWSLDMARTLYLAAGIPASRLVLGLAFYGWQWNGGVLDSDRAKGIDGPKEVWQTGYTPTGVQKRYSIVVTMVTQENYRWDASALVPYLTSPGSPAISWWITYDDPQSIRAKVQYIIAQNLGGWIIWHIGMDYTAGALKPHPLLSAIYDKPPLLRSGMSLR